MSENTIANDVPVGADAGARVESAAHADKSPDKGATRPLPDDALIIVPVRNVVLFPGLVFPLTVGRERSRAAAQEAARLQRPLGILLQSKPDVDEPGPDDLHWVGTTAVVLRYITAAEGVHHAICKGVQALSRPAVPGRLPVHGGARSGHRGARANRSGHRRSGAQPAGSAQSRSCSCCRRCPKRWCPRCRAWKAPRGSRTSSPG